jgi:hypothetical protein
LTGQRVDDCCRSLCASGSPAQPAPRMTIVFLAKLIVVVPFFSRIEDDDRERQEDDVDGL